MRFAEIDSTHFPVVIVSINPVNATLAEASVHMAEALQFVRSQTNKFVAVYDLTHIRMVSKEINLQFGKWMEIHQDEFRKHLTGIAYVSPSMITSVILKTIFMIAPPPAPHHAVLGNLPQAINWAHTVLEG